ncbi:MAG: hypothetical protein RJA70_2867 [Pseudomonadota bacterium]
MTRGPFFLVVATSISVAAVACVEDLASRTDFEGKLSVEPSPRVPNRPPGSNLNVKPSTNRMDAGQVTGPGNGPRPGEGPGEQDASGPTSPGLPSLPDGSSGDEDLLPAACGDVPRDLFGDPKKCGSSSCHGSEGQPPISAGRTDLGSKPDDVFKAMLGFKLKGGACEGRLVIDPLEPEASLLLAKLSEPAPCGLPMPLGSGLGVQEKECIELWIKAEIAAAK